MKTDVIVIGLGSIGLRHARVLKTLGASVTTVSRRAGVADVDNLSEAIQQKPNALLLVATETSGHLAVMMAAVNAGHRGPIVLEKPLGINVSDFSGWEPDRPVWIAYNMRYLPLIQAFKGALEALGSPILSVSAHAGQFLGEWRPERKVSETYSAHRSAGGGVLRDLSHELDLLNWLWGNPQRLTVLGGRLGKLTVDSDDCWNILMRTKGGVNISLGLNYMDRPAKRFLHAFNEFTTISANLVDGTLTVNGEVSHFPSDRDVSYREMWKDILQACDLGREPQACKFDEGLLVLSLVEQCEQSAATGEWISL